MGAETIAMLAEKKAENALRRVDVAEQRVDIVEKSILEIARKTEVKIDEFSTVMGAVVDILGTEVVKKAIEEKIVKDRKEQAAQQKAELDALLADGTLAAVPIVTEKALLVFKETHKDGVELPVSRVQLPFISLHQEFKTQLLGQGVGTKMTVKDGNTFEVLEIYEMTETAKQKMLEMQSQPQVESVKSTSP